MTLIPLWILSYGNNNVIENSYFSPLPFQFCVCLVWLEPKEFELRIQA